MRLGVVFPQTEIGSDPAVIRDYAQAAEGAGYDHLLVFDHVLGAKLERLDKLGRRPPYTRRPSSDRVPCGSAAWAIPCSSAWRRSPTAGFPSFSPETRRGRSWAACATTSRRRAERPRPSASKGGLPIPSADRTSGRG